MRLNTCFRSSLFYNTGARHELHECDTSNLNVATVRHKRHEWDTSEKWVLHERHEYYLNDTSATRVKNFDNHSSENMFSHPFISYIANEWLQKEEQFLSQELFGNALFCSHAKIRLKSAPQKLNSVMAKAIWKSFPLDCGCKSPCTVPHSYA